MRAESPKEFPSIDELFEDSRFFLEEARKHESRDQSVTRRYLRASVVTAFAALEAFVNTLLFILGEFGEDLELHERAFAQERSIQQVDEGYFEIRGRKHHSLEQKIKFLYWRTEGEAIPKGSPAWKAFRRAVEIRNRLAHPRPRKHAGSSLTVATAKACLIAVIKVSKMLGGPYSGVDAPGND